MSTWGQIILWIGLVVCTWLESKPRLVAAIESVFIWIDRRSAWWVLAAFILWTMIGQRFLIAFMESFNPPWPISLFVGFSWAIGSFAILGWGVMKLFTWALRPRSEPRLPTSGEIRSSAPASAQKNKAKRGRLYKSVKERRAQYLAMYKE